MGKRRRPADLDMIAPRPRRWRTARRLVFEGEKESAA
jgi:hypothetical protein